MDEIKLVDEMESRAGSKEILEQIRVIAKLKPGILDRSDLLVFVAGMNAMGKILHTYVLSEREENKLDHTIEQSKQICFAVWDQLAKELRDEGI